MDFFFIVLVSMIIISIVIPVSASQWKMASLVFKSPESLKEGIDQSNIIGFDTVLITVWPTDITNIRTSGKDLYFKPAIDYAKSKGMKVIILVDPKNTWITCQI